MSAAFLSDYTPLAKYKLVFVGNICVGKTSLINRFMYDTFDSNYQATIGIDFLSKTMYLGDRTVRLQLWDTAGQERFRCLIPNFIRDASLAVVVFDITNKQSFLDVDRWVDDLRTERGQEVIIVLVGNKTDLQEEREVTCEEAAVNAQRIGAAYIEASAKTGENVQQLFRHIVGTLPVDERLSNNEDQQDIVDIKLRAYAAQQAHTQARDCKC